MGLDLLRKEDKGCACNRTVFLDDIRLARLRCIACVSHSIFICLTLYYCMIIVFSCITLYLSQRNACLYLNAFV